MSSYVLPALYALFLWWFSTGLILYLNNLARWTFRWSMLGATVLLVLAGYGLVISAADPSQGGAYLAFSSGLGIWAWLEISFYLGYVTGSRKQLCEPGCSGWRHFGHAIQANLYHELAIIVFGIAVVALTWEQPNQIGVWTFVALWWMQLSAKLNVFLGVPNLNAHLLPEHLAFIRSFLTNKPMNLLFPVSVTVSTVVTWLLIQQAIAPAADAFTLAGYTFIATLMALAVLEHWFLVLPLPFTALWDWGLQTPVQPPGERADTLPSDRDEFVVLRRSF